MGLQSDERVILLRVKLRLCFCILVLCCCLSANYYYNINCTVHYCSVSYTAGLSISNLYFFSSCVSSVCHVAVFPVFCYAAISLMLLRHSPAPPPFILLFHPAFCHHHLVFLYFCLHFIFIVFSVQ